MVVLCAATDIAEGQSRGIEINGQALILVRRSGRVYAYQNRCPHTGVNLDWLPHQFLDNSGDYLQCAVHGALFRIEDGYCVSGPCAGEGLRPVAVREQQGEILLDTVNP